MSEKPRAALSLDYSKVSPEITSLEGKLSRDFAKYVPNLPFGNREEMVRGGLRIMDKYQISPLLLEDPTSAMLLLSVADAWAMTTALTEKRALLDVVKLISVLEVPGEGYKTVSGRVAALAEEGKPRGKNFDPTTKTITQAEGQKLRPDISKYADEHIDPELSKDLSRQIRKWDQTSPVHFVRKALKLKKKKQRPFRVVVVNKTSSQMSKDTGGAAWCVTRDDRKVLILGKDAVADPKSQHIKHEYAHAQSVGFMVGFRSYLFRALNEAVTNSNVGPEPATTYKLQGEVLGILTDASAIVRENLVNAFKGEHFARTKVLGGIAGVMGMRGLLNVARMDHIPGSVFHTAIERAIYIDPAEIIEQYFETAVDIDSLL